MAFSTVSRMFNQVTLDHGDRELYHYKNNDLWVGISGKEIRGIGGIFFDYETGNWIKNFKFVRELGLSFIDISSKIIERKKNSKWKQKDKEKQLIKRGRYVEFNLLYDRGTKFGLNSGGNIDSILMSLPPQAKWK